MCLLRLFFIELQKRKKIQIPLLQYFVNISFSLTFKETTRKKKMTAPLGTNYIKNATKKVYCHLIIGIKCLVGMLFKDEKSAHIILNLIHSSLRSKSKIK